MAGEIEELPQWFHYVGSKPTLVVSKGTVIFKSLPVYRDSKEESFPDFLTYGFDIDDSDGKGGCIQKLVISCLPITSITLSAYTDGFLWINRTYLGRRRKEQKLLQNEFLVLPNSWLSKKHYKFFPVLVRMRKMTTRSSYSSYTVLYCLSGDSGNLDLDKRRLSLSV